jgi:hypothetical protein
VLDTKAPVITVTAPAESVFFSAAQISVKGTIDEAVAALTINGILPSGNLNSAG